MLTNTLKNMIHALFLLEFQRIYKRVPKTYEFQLFLQAKEERIDEVLVLTENQLKRIVGEYFQK